MLILLYVHLLFMFGNAVDLPFNKDQGAGFFDPKAEDFCNLVCSKWDDGTDEENVACRCNKYRSPKTCTPYRTDQLLDFRKYILTLHNELRQKIASGEETNPNVGKASNMNAVSYDLGLEFAAMCTSMKCVMEHDHCRRMKKFRHVGQNLYFSMMSIDVFGMKNRTKDGVLMWYNELKIMPPNVVDKVVGNKAYGHFTAMMWASTTHLGCAITSDSKPPNQPKGYLSLMITCHYGVLNNKKAIINGETLPVYKRGEPVSACPKGRNRNSIFSALCGEIEPIPVGKMVPHHGGPSGPPGGCTRCHFNWVVIILGLVIISSY